MRWIWLITGMLGFGLAWMAKTPGLLGFGVILGLVGITMAVLAIAADRIQAGSRPETMMISPNELGQLRERAQAQRQPRPVAQPTPIRPPPRDFPQG
jgi:hypothetical protein